MTTMWRRCRKNEVPQSISQSPSSKSPRSKPLCGRRIIGDDVFDVAPGQGMHIPAEIPHRSLSEPSEVVCINIYMPSGAYAAQELISGLAPHWRRKGHIGWPDLTIMAENHGSFAGNIANPRGEHTVSE